MVTKARFSEIGADSLARMKLTFENTQDGSTERELFETLIALRTKKGIVYTTVCIAFETTYVFTTTSKEIHLALGSMPEEARTTFCMAINEELDLLQRPGLIFLPPMGDEHETQRSMHIMRSEVPGSKTIF